MWYNQRFTPPVQDPSAAYEWKLMTLSVDAIRIKPELQGRVNTDDTTVNRYARAMKQGDSFPPVTVARVDRKYYVIDGFHRLAAASKQKINTITANVATMTEVQATRMVIQANRTHGLPLKTRDKVRLFDLYIEDNGHLTPEGRVKSYRLISDDCANLISHTTVSTYLKRKGIEAGDPFEDNPHHKPWEYDENISDADREAEASVLINSLWRHFDTLEGQDYKNSVRNALGPLFDHMTRELTGIDYVPVLNARLPALEHYDPEIAYNILDI
jgi:uncharacterized ParB-like nuclease family protein